MTDIGSSHHVTAMRRPSSPTPTPSQYQLAYLQLQNQMLQSQFLLASATQQAMLGQAQAQAQAQAQEDSYKQHNPLVASALARRKRQSLTLALEPSQQSQHSAALSGPGRRTSYGGMPMTPQPYHQSPPLHQQQQQPPQAVHHRRTSSSLPFVGEPRRWSASSGSGGDTPALVLSKPGESFLPSPASTDSDGKVTPWLAGVQDASRRPSQAGSLAAALGRRQTSLAVDVDAPPLPRFQHPQPEPRVLSPFATTFQPLPPSPYSSSGFPTPTTRTPTPPRQLAAATAIRQPKGPATEAELPTSNFSARLRKNAIACLIARGGRMSLGGV